MNRLLVVVVLLAVTCLVSGQPQTSPPPKPGPEVLRLGSFVGTWKTETETVRYEWFKGGFSVIGHVENSGPEGKSSELRIITYDPDTKDYTQLQSHEHGSGGHIEQNDSQRKHVAGAMGRYGGREAGQIPFQHRQGHASLLYCKARSFSGRWAVDGHF